MNEPTTDNVVQRMDRLERENHRMKLAGVLVLLSMTAVTVMGQAKATKVAKVIEAERFVLRDENGKARGSLQVVAGVAGLILRDEKGTVSSTLVAAKDYAGLDIHLQNRSRLLLSSDLANTGLYIFDRHNKRRVSIGIHDKEGTPSIGILNKDEKMLIRLTELEGGSGFISLIRLGDKKSGLVFLESDGSSRIQLLSFKNDSGIGLFDKYGTKRATMNLVNGTPVIGIYDEQAKPVWGETGNR